MDYQLEELDRISRQTIQVKAKHEGEMAKIEEAFETLERRDESPQSELRA